MFEKIIDQINRNRPSEQRPLTKKEVISRLQQKELVTSYQYGIAMMNKLDKKDQDRISIPILKELSVIFKMTIDEIISYY